MSSILFKDFIKLTDATTEQLLYVRLSEIVLFEKHEKGTLIWLCGRMHNPRLVKECLQTIYKQVE
jgi:hypothetical protein